jgi:hypothetical protein
MDTSNIRDTIFSRDILGSWDFCNSRDSATLTVTATGYYIVEN